MGTNPWPSQLGGLAGFEVKDAGITVTSFILHSICGMTNPRPPSKPATELTQFDYELPKDLIAQQPLANRSDSRLMVVRRSEATIEHHHFRDLPELIREGDALVVNDSRVVPAKLVGYRKDTKGRWHGLWLESDSQPQLIRLLCKTRSQLQPNHQIVLPGSQRSGLLRIGNVDSIE